QAVSASGAKRAQRQRASYPRHMGTNDVRTETIFCLSALQQAPCFSLFRRLASVLSNVRRSLVLVPAQASPNEVIISLTQAAPVARRSDRKTGQPDSSPTLSAKKNPLPQNHRCIENHRAAISERHRQ